MPSFEDFVAGGKRLGKTEQEVLSGVELYRKEFGAFDDEQPKIAPEFRPDQVLNQNPAPSLAGEDRAEFEAVLSPADTARFRLRDYYTGKDNVDYTDDLILDERIRGEFGINEDSDIDYAGVNRQLSDMYYGYAQQKESAGVSEISKTAARSLVTTAANALGEFSKAVQFMPVGGPMTFTSYFTEDRTIRERLEQGIDAQQVVVETIEGAIPEDWNKAVELVRNEMGDEGTNFFKMGALLLADNAGNLAAGMANPLVSYAAMAANESRLMRDELIKSGMDKVTADNFAGMYGSVSGLIEHFEFRGRVGSAFRKAKGATAVGSVGRKIAVKLLKKMGVATSNVGEEISQDILFNLVYNAAIERSNTENGTNIQPKKVIDLEDLRKTSKASLAMSTVMEAIGIPVQFGRSRINVASETATFSNELGLSEAKAHEYATARAGAESQAEFDAINKELTADVETAQAESEARTKEFTKRAQEFKFAPINKAEPILQPNGDIWTPSDFRSIRDNSSDAQINDMMEGELKAVFIKAVNGDGQAQAEYNRYITGEKEVAPEAGADDEIAQAEEGQVIDISGVTEEQVSEARYEKNVSMELDEIGLTKAEAATIRENQGYAEFSPAQKITFNSKLKEAKETGLDADASAVARDIISNPRALSPAEFAGFVVRTGQLITDLNENLASYQQAAVMKDSVAIGRINERMNQINEELDVITQADDIGGTVAAQALSIRRLRINAETFDLASVARRAITSKGGENLTTIETQQLSDLTRLLDSQTAEVTKLQGQITQLREEAAQAMAREFVVETQAEKRIKRKKEQVRAERKDIKAELRAMGYRVNDVTGVTAEGAKLITRLAKTYIQEGVADLAEVTRKIREDLPDLSEKNVWDAFSGKVKSETKRATSELTLRVNELKKQSRLLSDITESYDSIFKEAGISPPNEMAVNKILKSIDHLEATINNTTADDARAKEILMQLVKVRDIVNNAYREYKATTTDSESLKSAKKALGKAGAELSQNERLAILKEFLNTNNPAGAGASQSQASMELSDFRSRIHEMSRELEAAEGKKLTATRQANLDKRIAELSAEVEGWYRAMRPAKPKELAGEAQRKQLLKQRRQQDTIGELFNILETKTVPTAKANKEQVGSKEYANTIKAMREQLKAEEWFQEAQQVKKEASRLIKTKANLADMERRIEEQDFEGFVSKRQEVTIKDEALVEALYRESKLKKQIRAKIADLAPKTLKDYLGEILSTPRALLATADMSYALRQGLLVSVGHPVIAAKAFKGAVKAFFSEDAAERMEFALKSMPEQMTRDKYGLHMADSLTAREEFFITGFLNTLPRALGGGVMRGSERNMRVGLNLLRAGIFDDFIAKHPSASEESKRAYAKYVNIATGRGDLGTFSQAANKLALAFFAPRFAVSRIQAPLYAVSAAVKHKELRGELARQWGAFIGTGLTVLALAKLAGAEIGDDPEKSDFGKIVVGDTRIDIWGGLIQPARLQALTVKAIALGLAGKGEDIDYNLPDAYLRFLKYKAAPWLSSGYQATTGKHWVTDKDMNRTEAVMRGVTPIIIQTVYEAWERDMDSSEAALSIIPEFFGASTMTFD